MITPSRLVLARHLRGERASELARTVGVSPGRISQLEGGKGADASEDLVNRLCTALDVPRAFLTAPDVPAAETFRVHYRHRARTAAWLRHRVEAQNVLFMELVREFARHVPALTCAALPKYPRGKLHQDGLIHAEFAADRVRRDWQLGDGPIPDIIALMESKGVWVQNLMPDSLHIDAFSQWGPDGHAYVFLNPAKDDVARIRLDCGHELGHLIMHENLETGDRALESEAFRFGAALLVPARAWRVEAPRRGVTDWRNYLTLSERWRLSIQALIRRSFSLEIIDESEYRSAMIRVSAELGRANEASVRTPWWPEEPRRVTSYLSALQRTGIDVAALLSDLGFPTDLAAAFDPPPVKAGFVIDFPRDRRLKTT